MKQARISVVVCTYNGEKYLHQQLNSIYNQTRLPDEVIILDDNSIDNSLKIIEEFKHKNNHLHTKIIKNEKNLGYVKNFSNGILKASMDIIALSDQDDIWHKDKLLSIEKYFQKNKGSLAVFSNAFIIDKCSKKTSKNLWSNFGYKFHKKDNNNLGILKKLLKRDFVTGATLAFRASMINYIIPIDEHYVHDAWISILAASQNKLGAINKKLIYYRNHDGQSIGLQNKSFFNEAFFNKTVDKIKYNNNILKYNNLLQRLADFNLYTEDAKKLIIDKKDFFIERNNYSHFIIKRLFQATKVFTRGGYIRFSKSAMLSYLKDIINLGSNK